MFKWLWWNRKTEQAKAEMAWYRLEVDRLQAKIDRLSSLTDPSITNQLREVCGDIQALVTVCQSEPFVALKTWIDRSTEDRRSSMNRERELLERWKSHTAALEEQIKVLQQELLRVTGTQP